MKAPKGSRAFDFVTYSRHVSMGAFKREKMSDMSTVILFQNFKATEKKSVFKSHIERGKTCTPGSFLISILLRWLRYHGVLCCGG